VIAFREKSPSAAQRPAGPQMFSETLRRDSRKVFSNVDPDHLATSRERHRALQIQVETERYCDIANRSWYPANPAKSNKRGSKSPSKLQAAQELSEECLLP
jgi:hypothetical protein